MKELKVKCIFKKMLSSTILGFAVGMGGVITGFGLNYLHKDETSVIENNALQLSNFYQSGIFFTFLLLCLYAPILEELFFRYLPFIIYKRLFSDDKILFWVFGLSQGLLFAGSHIHTGVKILPIWQFLLGMISWYRIRKHGYIGSIFLHFGANFCIFLSFKLLLLL